MRLLGGLLLAIGFFGAAFVTVRHSDSTGLEWQTIEWSWYAMPFVGGVLGVVILRATAKATDTHAHKLDSDLATMESSLDAIVERLTAMCANWKTIHVYDVHDRIDEVLVPDLGAFVEARESLIPLYGLQHYADLMSEFAGSERYINRAWSASADGYIDEVWASLDTALGKMSKARELLAEYKNVQETGAMMPNA